MKTGYITPSEYHEHPLPFSCSSKQVICSEDISYEEVPPGSSTKASFTTAQVKELGQALEISQLHRSLENISTFLEEKFIEDSDDLEQSSDKETTSHFKRKAFDSTFKRPSKRRKSEQCNSATQSLSSVTQQLKSLSSVPQRRKRQSGVARLLTPLLMTF